MQSTILASRAVLVEYARRLIRPFVWLGVAVFAVLLALTAYLATQLSAWWWLLLIIIIAYGLVLTMGLMIITFALKRLRPDQNNPQREAVKNFVDSVEKLSDLLQLGKFGLIVKVIRDVLLGKGTHNVLSETVNSSATLKKEFKAVIESFA